MNTKVSKCCNPEVKGEGKDCSIGSFGMDERLNAECLSMPTEQATERVEKPAEGKVDRELITKICQLNLFGCNEGGFYGECALTFPKKDCEKLWKIMNWHTTELNRERERIVEKIEKDISVINSLLSKYDFKVDMYNIVELTNRRGGYENAIKIVQSAGKKL